MRILAPLVGLAVVAADYNGAWSPSGGYAPAEVPCPNATLVRKADSLSKGETEWLESKREVANQHLEAFLNQAGLTDFNVSEFMANTTKNITIGVAFSGGGYRAMLSGAGQLSALDNRTTNASEAGLGGILQAATYLTGLSGGNWLVGSVVLNNWTSIQDIVDKREIWDIERSIVDYGGWNPVKAYDYYSDLYDDVLAKQDAGFEVSITDTWGRALSHQFFPESVSYGDLILWSQIQTLDAFTSHEMPFPIVVADGRTPGTMVISGNSTIFEFTPFELGSWDPSLYLFTDIRYIGSDLTNGATNGTCVGGYDNAGFVMGTSSTLFNQFVLQINTTSISLILKSLITKILDEVSKDEDDIAIYSPNPFYHAETAAISSIVKNDTLFLVDGGEDNQNIPIYPLLQPEREVDVIFAYDNSADTNQNWPNGSSLVFSYQRQSGVQGNGTIFPYVPDTASFRNLNLTSRPAFFGCDARNLTSLLSNTSDTSAAYSSPLIIYTANRPFSYYSNTLTFKLSYSDFEKRGMIKNGFEVALRLNNSLDAEWPACVACAIIRREQERLGIEQSDQCKQCFSRYCWDGSIDISSPEVNFTVTGTTNGTESTGNTTSGAAALIGHGGSHATVTVLGYAMVFVVACLYVI